MGNSKKKFSILRNLFFIFLTFIYNIKIRIMTKGKKELIQDFLNIHTIYAELLASHLNKFDGILTLFAVDKKCQGVGVGKQLLNNLFCYLGQCRVKNIYLFTDSSCNYGFYDHQGFVCLEETSLQMGDSAAYLDVYLYAKNFS